MQTQYRNTDLDLVSVEPLDALNQRLEADGLIVLGHHQNAEGDWTSVLEIVGGEDDRFHQTCDATIMAMLDVLERLPADAQRLLARCKMREFNAAFDLGTEPLDFNQSLSAQTISRMAALRASFRVTLYPGED